jgi:DNA-directed RNA polymerase II subunit RPB11
MNLTRIRISYEKDTKVPNSGTFTIQKEDHTLGSLLSSHLLQNPNVLFAGYKKPHPLEHHILVRIQTVPETDPVTVFMSTLEQLRDDVQLLDERLEQKVKQKQQQHDPPQQQQQSFQAVNKQWF